MATGASGTNGLSARRIVISVTKLEIDLATTHHLLLVVNTALPMVRAIQNLECAITKDALVSISMT